MFFLVRYLRSETKRATLLRKSSQNAPIANIWKEDFNFHFCRGSFCFVLFCLVLLRSCAILKSPFGFRKDKPWGTDRSPPKEIRRFHIPLCNFSMASISEEGECPSGTLQRSKSVFLPYVCLKYQRQGELVPGDTH